MALSAEMLARHHAATRIAMFVGVHDEAGTLDYAADILKGQTGAAILGLCALVGTAAVREFVNDVLPEPDRRGPVLVYSRSNAVGNTGVE
jgi:hypothetical protein